MSALLTIDPALGYEKTYAQFRWNVPARYNIGVDACDRHPPHLPALIFRDLDGAQRVYTFGEMRALSNQLANLLMARGVQRGERVAILLGQRPETAFAHIAIYKIGAIAMPLFTLFGEEALEYRLGNSEACLLITDRENWPKVAALRDRLPALREVLLIDGQEDGALPLYRELEKASDSFAPVDTGADDPALLIYTSGTTGPPKGALHAQRVLLGHMTGCIYLYNGLPIPGDVLWSPADWAWAGGLLDVLLPAWQVGLPVVAWRNRKFDPEEAFHIISTFGVTSSLLMPTMLKLMRQVPQARERFPLKLRSIWTGGESVGAELIDWGRDYFGVPINEGYGQTECNLVIGQCGALAEPVPGALGRPIPGHDVAIVDDEGNKVPDGQIGHIGIRRPDPVMLLEYWRNPKATAEKFAGDWLLTGDLGHRDPQGYLWFQGRADDVITSAGYRIGPGEIESCLTNHPAVALAAAIGVPDPMRTEVIKAFVMLRPGLQPSAQLEDEIRGFVRSRLAAHEYPRLIEFVDELPTTITGKIMRRELRQRELDRIKRQEAGA